MKAPRLIVSSVMCVVCVLAMLPMIAFAQAPPATQLARPSSRYTELPTELAMKTGKFDKVSAGDVVELKITVPSSESAADYAPSVADKMKEGPVEWGVGRILSWKRGEGLDQGKIIIDLTTYTPGEFVIAPIPLKREKADSAAPAYASEEKKVPYFAIGGDRSKDDVYPPEGIIFPKWLLLLIGLLVLAAVLATIGLVARWYGQKRREIKKLASAPRVLNPLEEFEKNRVDTERKGFLEKQAFKPHYFALSDAAKRFLGRAYRFSAEERTARELVMELEGLRMPSDLIDQWEQLFNEMDVTKFTDQKPDVNAARGLADRIALLAAKSYRTSPVAREGRS